MLLGGVPGVHPAEVVILGGIVGVNAARVAMGMGARSLVIDLMCRGCVTWMKPTAAGC